MSLTESGPAVRVFGIRHHGPGSARSLVAALQELQPDQVLIEGPADADPLIGWAGSEQTVPPVALLAYVPDRPSRAAFWPFAVFSPEWQAITWALGHGVPVGFCDLPAAVTLAARPASDAEELPLEPEPEAQVAEAPGRRRIRHDPLAVLAETAGYDDAERWWDDVVESRLDGSSPFPVLAEAMAEVRAQLPETDPGEAQREARREAYMRQRIRAALKAGRRRVAVVCGAWHAPALSTPLPAAAGDARILRGLPKTTVRTTWVPWTHRRLGYASGYGAGIASPGWYHHLWSAPDRPVTRWLTRVAGALRTKDLAVSSAHVIESVRLAETLAALRDRPLAGLAEVDDATRSVLCEGDETLARFVTEELVVGQALGRVDPGVPTVPLDADLQARCRRLRIKREAVVRVHDLDLRKPFDQDKSVLFHRLRTLDLDWVRPAESDVQGRGTFRETWQSEWRPELAVALVEAAAWGTTVETAATAKILDLSGSGSLPELTRAVERCLLADLPDALQRLLAALAERAALDADVVHLMEALPPLARAQRYGDVRGTDTTALAQVGQTLLIRVCASLPPATTGLDAESARELRQRMDRVHAAVALLQASAAAGDAPLDRWLDTLTGLLGRTDLPGEIAGRVVRVLFDAERVGDVPVRVHRALSYGAPAAEKAAWVDGFFSDGALLLVHDAELRGLVDAWVVGLDDDEFADVVPLVRRTFATFSAPERRLIGERLDAVRRAAPAEDLDDDLALAAPALATVDLILGRPR